MKRIIIVLVFFVFGIFSVFPAGADDKQLGLEKRLAGFHDNDADKAKEEVAAILRVSPRSIKAAYRYANAWRIEFPDGLIYFTNNLRELRDERRRSESAGAHIAKDFYDHHEEKNEPDSIYDFIEAKKRELNTSLESGKCGDFFLIRRYNRNGEFDDIVKDWEARWGEEENYECLKILYEKFYRDEATSAHYKNLMFNKAIEEKKYEEALPLAKTPEEYEKLINEAKKDGDCSTLARAYRELKNNKAADEYGEAAMEALFAKKDPAKKDYETVKELILRIPNDTHRQEAINRLAEWAESVGEIEEAAHLFSFFSTPEGQSRSEKLYRNLAREAMDSGDLDVAERMLWRCISEDNRFISKDNDDSDKQRLERLLEERRAAHPEDYPDDYFKIEKYFGENTGAYRDWLVRAAEALKAKGDFYGYYYHLDMADKITE